MKTIFFFILAFLTPSIIFSNSVDSLLQVTQSNQHDTIKITVFYSKREHANSKAID